MYLTLPEESIVTGLYVLALMPIRVFIPPLSGIKSASLLEPGGRGVNFVVFATRRGETTPAIVLLSSMNVTVWGSAARSVGLYHVTLWPALISMRWGINIVQGAVAFPPPAATFTTAVGCSCAPVLLIWKVLIVVVNNVIIIPTAIDLFKLKIVYH